MNKKSKIFMIGTVLLFLIYIMSRLYLTSTAKINKFESIIGEGQVDILETYKRAEKFLYFSDNAAKFAFSDTLNDLSSGNYLTGCPSGREGYPLINGDCDIATGISNSFSDNMNEYLDTYEEVPNLRYELGFVEGAVIGKTSYLRMDVRDDEVYNFEIEEIGYTYEIDDGDQQPLPSGGSDDSQQGGGQMPQSAGKCGFVADYAKKYIGCPYSLTEVYVLPYQNCRNGGLTCATFVGSVIAYTLGWQHYPYGHGRDKCSNDKVVMLGTNTNNLQPGDIFASEYRRRDGTFTPWGHTGMYVGRGHLVEGTYDGPFCYRQYTPDANGEPIFIHSYGWSNMGPPGVCYDSYNHLFVGSQLVLTSFCRPEACT